MVLFIAHYPEGEDSRDGMAQRILAIDRLFENEERTYLALSARRFWLPRIRRIGKLKIIQCHCIIGLPLFVIETIKCNILYIHSVANALWIIFFLPWLNFVIDLHGVVPEEEAFAGRKARAMLYGWVERVCLNYALVLICVTKQMEFHLKRKYSHFKFKVIILPIMEFTEEIFRKNESYKFDREQPKVIYSGGTQAWQNVDKMIDAMSHAKGAVRFEVYTPAVNEFSAKLDKTSVVCLVQSLGKEVLIERYQDADFGFLLRDPVLVNRVACPTKLGEYMRFGIIPIVSQPNIGDMNELGFAYVTLDDFRAGRLPDEEKRLTMRKKNWAVMRELANMFHTGALEINEIVKLYSR